MDGVKNGLTRAQRSFGSGKEDEYNGRIIEEPDELPAHPKLHHERDDVQGDQGQVHDREAARRDVVPKRYQPATSSRRASRHGRSGGRPSAPYRAFDSTE